jgi:Protein of unknown function (DUF1552)
MTSIINRRTLLHGAGGALIGLPLLGRMAHAATTVPRRFIVMFSPNGTVFENWIPSGGETNFALSPILAPLEPHRKDIVVISGVDQQQGGGGDAHVRGMGCMLTGLPVNAGGTWGGNGSWAGGISVDQEIAKKIGNDTKFRSLELGVGVGLGPPGNTPTSVWTRMSYLGSNAPVPPENSPYQAFARIFSALGDDPTGALRIRAQRKTILDGMKSEYASLIAKLGGDDKVRVEAHLQAIRDIELALDREPGGGIGCKKPVQGNAIDFLKNDNHGAVGRLQTDLMVMAMACDLTRVASLQWSHSVGETRFSWLGIIEGHHEISHKGDSDTTARDQLTKINRWYAEQLAYLIGKLKEMPEEGGTMLDHTLILWCNELGKGNAHSGLDAPYVLAGRAGGKLRTGRFLAMPGNVPHNNLLVSLLNAMDIPATRFGKPEWCTGPLAGLV